jgi:membrane protein YdbS with pleckstrin-like domain
MSRDGGSEPRGGPETDLVFAPPGEPWRRVSPRLATARRIGLAGTLLVLLVAAIVALAVLSAPGWSYPVAVTVAVLLGTWGSWLIGRRVRAYGYAERADDLLVTSGILLRRLVIVPYGRMQLVDVVAGPLDRALGIATLQLHTAAATTDATIPGLRPEEAATLRDRLAARGEERSAGL